MKVAYQLIIINALNAIKILIVYQNFQNMSLVIAYVNRAIMMT